MGLVWARVEAGSGLGEHSWSEVLEYRRLKGSERWALRTGGGGGAFDRAEQQGLRIGLEGNG